MWWKTLGVKPDADIETIKKAYSALIKTYRPEEHPEQFSQIRQAFELARKQAGTPTRIPSSKERQPVEPSDIHCEQPVQIEVADVKEEPVRIVIDESQPLPQKRIEPITTKSEQEESILDLLEHWKKSKFKNNTYIDRVLNHPDTHDFIELKKAGHEVFSWLIKYVQPASGLLATSINMPARELAKLNSLFGWSLKERALYQQYKEHDLSLVFFGIASGQSARLYRNPIVMQKADIKQKSNNTLIEKIIHWGTGIILIYIFILIIAMFIAALQQDQYILAGLWCVLFYLMLDGLYYSFTGLKKIGVLRNSVLTPKVRMWGLGLRRLFMGLITLGVIVILEGIGFGTLYWIGSSINADNAVLLLTILLPALYLVYWLNKEIFLYSRHRYYQLIRDFERIKLGKL